MHKDASNMLTLTHCVYRQPDYFNVNMLICRFSTSARRTVGEIRSYVPREQCSTRPRVTATGGTTSSADEQKQAAS